MRRLDGTRPEAATTATEPVRYSQSRFSYVVSDTPTFPVTFATSLAEREAESALLIRMPSKAVYRVPGHTIGEATMALRRFSGVGLAAVLAAGLLASGCTPDDDPSTGPTASSGVTATPTSTPTPARSETAEEKKQREAFEAAERAYRANFDEVGRLATKGGINTPTDLMKRTATGSYLDIQMESLRFLESEDARASQLGTIGWVRHNGYAANELSLLSCEDFSKVVLIESSGATLKPENAGTRIAVQTIKVVRSSGGWKLADVDSRQVKRC